MARNFSYKYEKSDAAILEAFSPEGLGLGSGWWGGRSDPAFPKSNDAVAFLARLPPRGLLPVGVRRIDEEKEKRMRRLNDDVDDGTNR